MSEIPRERIGDLPLDAVTRKSAVAAILRLADCTAGPSLVCTPNIAHFHQAHQFPSVLNCYKLVTLSPPDGWPVALVGRYMFRGGSNHVSRSPGSDLTMDLLQLPLRFCFIGGEAGAAIKAGEVAEAGGVAKTVSTEPVPPIELSNSAARERLVERLAATNADVFLIGLGVPKQESLALELMAVIDRGVVMCVGASIDFMAGVKPRAPHWVQAIGAEWLFRILKEPGRLSRRYAAAAPYFVAVLLSEWKRRLVR